MDLRFPAKRVAIAALRQARDFVRQFPQVHRTIRSVWTPPKRIYQHLYFDGLITVDVGPGASFQINCHGEFVENELFWRGLGTGWEGKSLRLWTELARSAEYVADIGSNTGVYSLLTKAVNPVARVLALEPSPRVFAKLQANIALNGYSIIAIDKAASDRSGTATFYDFASPHQYTGSLERESGGHLVTTVSVAPMDDILPKNRFDRIDLVKIDVELHEPAVLRGMRSSLERFKPTMLVEILNADVERGIREALVGLGYWMAPVGVEDSPDPVADARNFLIAQRDIFRAIEISTGEPEPIP